MTLSIDVWRSPCFALLPSVFRGNSRVPERNHTVVLGHNRQLVEVLRQVRPQGEAADSSCQGLWAAYVPSLVSCPWS